MNKNIICRDCEHNHSLSSLVYCPACSSPRFVQHPEIHNLPIAHIDCDAFFATVEKRDNPELVDKPLIIGGGVRGVVSTCCYIARQSGVHSAMPMYKALVVCPDAIVLKPNIKKYRRVAEQTRMLMREATSLIEPVSIDEAYLDLSDLSISYDNSPALALIRLTNRLESQLGISASVGLAPNKFLAKLASDFDKPRGFSVIGRNDAMDILRPLSVKKINGVGPVLARKLAQAGITTIAQLQSRTERDLVARFGSIGHSLTHFCRGHDPRPVKPQRKRKSISAETTFESDVDDLQTLQETIRLLANRLCDRLLNSAKATTVVTLKLKTSRFRTFTRAYTLHHATQQPNVIYETAKHLLSKEIKPNQKFRLVGLGASKLVETEEAVPSPTLELEF